jgi:serine/threonine protein kinase
MTHSSFAHCAGCEHPLRLDDRFCSRCGMPTPLNVDADATLVDRSAREDSVPPGDEGDATLVDPSRSDEFTSPVTDGDATLVDETGSAGSAAPSDDKDVTIPTGVPQPQAPPEGASFTTRFQYVLGTEYELLSLIGQGGFARVYKAWDRRLDRIVAIKVIRPDLVETELFWESFRNEAIALAKLRHPGIVPIYDIRERGGLIYYIMPFVEGTTLEARLERTRLPPFESRRILSELTDALAAAHRAKMVHLDIKPANVFLEGDIQKVLLMDFGIAMALSEQIEDVTGGPVIGTPAYMSPEQARGLADIDHRSDIYSVGALGYRMLTGRPPFSAAEPADVLRKHISQPPVPIRDINPTIPKDFADAIMRCLEKDPWDRFSTAKELGGALQSVTFFTAGAETLEGDASSGVHSSIVVLLACIALLLGILLGLALG